MVGPPTDFSGPATPRRLPHATPLPTDPATGPATCIHDLIDDRVALGPDAVAVVDPAGRALSYRELENRAEALAIHLRAAGVAPDERVALCLPRCLDLIVAMLAVLRAGGAYVPLDLDHPDERLAFIIEDAAPRLVLTHLALAGRAAHIARAAAPVLAIDTLPASPAVGRSAPTVGPRHLAYVIYTSGSTGRPKGVLIEHRDLVDRARAIAARFELGPGDGMLQFCSPAFDVSVGEIFPCLISGARLVLRDEDMLAHPAAFFSACAGRGVTAMFLPTAYWAFLGTQGEAAALAAPPGLRLVAFAGERATPEALSGWLRLAGGRVRLINGYGPTEATIIATWTPDLTAEEPDPPIGHDLPGVATHVLDTALRPVAPGEIGELYLGGGGLARGYLNRPELTAERFPADPFSTEPGARLYRTGDLVRRRPDGQLEFRSRADRQVKIRGHRVEPDEVEAVLATHPDLAATLILVLPGPGDAPMLAAFAGLRDPARAPSPAGLRAWLAVRLPDPCIPAQILVLPTLPIGVGGKIDRAALAALAAEDTRSGAAAFVAPRNETERTLAEIWAEALRLPRVGIHDAFLDLGGHSLLAMRIAARVRGRLGVDLPVKLLFQHPTIADLAPRLVTIHSPAAANEAADEPGRPAPGLAPLSFTQQSLWFIDRLAGGGTAYLIPLAFELKGPLDAPALRRALQTIVDRHESLRTTFPAIDGRPVQQIAPRLALDLPLVDLSALPPAARADAAAEARRAERAAAFDLAGDALFRARLLRLAPDEHLLLATVHHIVFDGWSGAVFKHELGALYTAYSLDRPDPLPPPALQYPAYAIRQHERLRGAYLAHRLDYWRARLADLPTLELPTDFPRPSVQGYQGSLHRFELPADLARRLAGFERAERLTPFMSLLAGFQVLLARHCGRTDIPVGTPFANRREETLEGLVGFFANTLVVRTELGDNPSFRALAARVRDQTLADAEHDDLPFERLVEALNPVRDPARHPLFQVLFALQNAGGEPLRLPPLRVSVPPPETETTHFDLELHLDRTDGRWTGFFAYSTALFARDTIERLATRFIALLDALLADPGRPVLDLPFLPAAELARLRALGRGPAPVPPPHASPESGVHALFEAQARRTPDAEAVLFGDSSLSYRELDARAETLAGHLRRMGAGPDTLVAVHLPRSLDLAAAVLGILKSGAAYVPLDPALPPPRLHGILGQTRCLALVSTSSLRARLESGSSAADQASPAALDLDALPPPAAIPDPPPRAPAPTDLAYVLFTSGSTGAPKGVEMPHRALVNLLQWQAASSTAGPGARTLQFANLGFDVSFQEMFSTWSTGGSLLLVDEDTRRDPEALLTLIAKRRVERLFLPFVMFEQLAAAARRRERLPSGLREILVAGEALRLTPEIRGFLERLPGCRLWNHYGPTEAHVVTAHSLSGPVCDWPALPPIGRPLPGCEILLLDARGQLAPEGSPGELCIGGVCLARGYLGQPALTAERFIPHPFEPGARLYRSGDLARWLPDGSLACLGRLDHQLKIHGHRVEPGEIEAVLGAHPGLAACAVVNHPTADGRPRLVAWFVPAPQSPAPAQLRAWLAARLPAHLVPGVFQAVETLPLSANGKVDRSALSRRPLVPETGSADSPDSAPPPPLTAREIAVAAIWRELLQRDPIGIHDNFFEIGGHSLLAMQVVGRLHRAFGADLPVRVLFEHPTIAGLAALLPDPVDALAAIQPARGCVPGSHASPAPSPAIPGSLSPASIPSTPSPVAARHRSSAPRPLSFAQQRLWFLDRFQGGSREYHLPLTLAFHGALDRAALHQALQALVDRHESLRTAFPEIDGAPVQSVAPSLALPLPFTDLSDLAPGSGTRETALNQARQAHAAAPFDLASGPTLRARLIRLATDHHVLLLCVHHIVTDGWSQQILLRELTAAYVAATAGRPLDLPPLPLQYPDYAVWQRERLQGAELARQLAYWTARLASPPTLELPSDHPRPARLGHDGREVRFTLPPPLSARLAAFNRAERVTPFMTLLATYQLLLARHSGQDDILIGTPVANRDCELESVEGLIGFFANTLVLRADLSGDPDFRQLIRRVRDDTLDAFDHQDLPFDKLVEALNPPRDPGRHPLFQASFSLHNAGLAPSGIPGLRSEILDGEIESAHFDLELTLIGRDGSWDAGLTYRTDLFLPATIERLAARFLTLLDAALADPDRPVSRLDLLPPGERLRLLREAEPASSAYPRDQGIPALFSAQAARNPRAVALAAGAITLTYAELDAASDRLARRLRALGVGPAETPVGVYLDRSPALVVALLAILKAGGAYVPLPKDHPAARLRFMLADTGAPLVIADAPPPPGLDFPGAWLNKLANEAPAADAEAPAPDLGPSAAERLAYVIYTSGSTGAPKGVAVEHRAIVRLVRGQDYADFRPGECFLLLAPTAFDASTFELWGPLLNGARCVIAPEGRLDLETLETLVREAGVTCLWLTAGLFNQIADLHPSLFGAVRHVITGGEALSPVHVRRVLASHPGLRLTNGYGPTECTTFALTHRIDPSETFAAGSVPVGRPIAHTSAYILDPRLAPAPEGVAGELFLGGDGLARGYLNQPALTAEKFIPHPFSTAPGARLYRTGDRCLRRADGEIEFLGRLDQQVKIRGFRIEPGEVEAALAALPEVTRAVVLVREDTPGEKRLVAYLTPADPAAAPAPAALRAALGARLPDYLVPAAFVVLPTLPLTPNGKVDRRALPAPGPAGARDETTYTAPRDATEAAIVAIWAEILRLPAVGIHDHFFHIGGHSLLAARVVARLRSRLHIELPLRLLFEHPTVAALSAHLPGLKNRAALPPLPVAPAPRDTPPPPPSFAQQRLCFLERYQNTRSHYHLELALDLRGTLDQPALHRALQAIVDRHQCLRAAFPERDGHPGLKIEPVLRLALPLEDLSARPSDAREADLAAIRAAELAAPFDLAAGPLLRLRLVRLAPASHTLIATFHHLVSDGWSLGIFERELVALHSAFARGLPDPLPPLTLHYPDYVARQRAELSGATLARLIDHWTTRLRGAPPELELTPVLPPAPTLGGPRSARAFAELSATTTTALDALCRGQGATLFMGLLTAFKVVLARLADQTDIVVGTPVTGRPRPEFEHLIGLFVGTLALRTNLADTTTFTDALGRVRDTCLDAFDHEELPFEKLIEALQPERHLDRHPVFQIFFNFFPPAETPPPAEDLGLAFTTLPALPQEAKFDLTVYAFPREGRVEFQALYPTARYHAATIDRLLAGLVGLLDQIVADPARPLAARPLLLPADAALLPDPAAPLETPSFSPVADLVAAQAARAPEHPAVTQDDHTWSYRALHDAARALQTDLEGVGARPGEVVAIDGARSFALIAAVVGVLYARGVLLLIDPALPPARRRLLLAQGGAKWLLTPAGAPTGTSISPLQPSGRSLPPLDTPASPGDPAYVFFTSGTTGAPKAVLGGRRGLAHFLAWEREFLAVRPEDRVAQLTAPGFDVILRDIFLPLTSGATLCLPPAGRPAADPATFAWLRSARITILHTVPSLAAAWLDDESPGAAPRPPAALRAVLFAGEPLSDRLVTRWRGSLGHAARIVNLYGPTETTLAKCHHVVADPPPPGIQPVGLPLPQTQALVLGPGARRCGLGEVGEVVLRTPFRTLGYLDEDPGAPARFQPSPFTGDPLDLLYFTGDRGRYDGDGLLHLLGRLDDQVKIRGVRVEPAEVAEHLASSPSVGRCAVVARELDGEKALVAYVVPARADAPPTTPALREFLRARLPEALVPARFILLPALPLGPNGKLDRRALPDPSPSNDASESAFVGPRDFVEEIIAGAWAEVLRRPAVGIHDDFFRLGGHSLLAMQVVARLRRRLSVELPLRLLFEFPTVAGLRAHLPGDSVAPSPSARLAPDSAPGQDRPLSFAQEGLWLLDRMQGGSAEYHIPIAYELRGALVLDALQLALRTLVMRHESLRTAFPEIDGQPVQRVARDPVFQTAFTDLSSLAPEARTRALAQARAAERDTPFDFAAGPLFRAGLLRLAPEHHVLLLTFHHIIFDGWSQGIVINELSVLYAAFAAGRPDPLPALPLQYPDYSDWQRGWLQGAELERQIVHWRSRLAAPATLELPTDHPRPGAPGHRGACHHFTLPAALSRRLAEFNRAEGATPFMTLLAVYQSLLARHSGQDDILVGTPVANRKLDQFENLIGFFVNTLVFRADFTGRPSFRELVGRIRAEALAAYEHQDLPFEKLVAALNPPRELGRHPLYQAAFALQNNQRQTFALPGLAVEPLAGESTTTHFDLDLHFSAEPDAEGHQTWAGALSYRTDLFDPATIARLAGHFVHLLTRLLDDPNRPVAATDPLAPAERHQLLHAWNQTAGDTPGVPSLPALLAAQVARTPHAVALSAGPASLSYTELDAEAARLARRLRALGVGPEVRVGLCAERTPRLLAALLGILKAGGAYVPLDPHFPAHRLALIIEDAGLGALVTESALRPLCATHAGPVLLLDADPAPAETAAAEPPPPDLTPENAAYVLFTSGSTGRPKGVVIEHRAVLNFLASMAREPGLGPDDVLAALTTISFDISVLELFLPLSVGARIELVPDDTRADGAQLAALLERAGATVLQATPATWKLLRQAGWAGSPRLRALVGGEALPPDLAAWLLPRCAELWNLYGPTETTVWSLLDRVADPAAITIGRPITNTRVYILDTHGQPVPVGVAGELWIAGEGLARGYHQRPELTAERFVPEPFASESSSSTPYLLATRYPLLATSASPRAYRTGDLCRWRADGRVEYLGRIDAQVKLRGFRIELGEIESVLRQHPGAREAVVTLRRDPPGDERLVAYIVPADPATPPAAAALREHLAHRLPDYMVPAAFVALPALPLTPNGKIDRRALPAPAAPTPSASGPTETAGDPRNALERDLAVLWADALGRPRVGREENFFAAGGHSLLAARISAGLLRHTGRRLPIAVFFTAPTIAAMAAWLDAAPDAPVSRALVTLQPKGDVPALFCVHGYGGDAYVYLHLAKDLGPDRPLVGVQAIGLDGRRPRHTTVEQMAAHYADEIVAHQPAGPYHLLGFSAGGWMAYAVAQELRARGATIGLLAVLDTHANARLPLWLHVWESVNQACKRAVARWHEREAFVGRLRALPSRQLGPYLLDRLRYLFGRRTKALPPVAADELAPPPLRRAIHDPDKSPEYYSIAVTRYSARPYVGDLVIFSSNPDGYFRWSFWPRLVRGRVTIERAQGAHIDLLEPENTPSLARSLRRLLANAERRDT